MVQYRNFAEYLREQIKGLEAVEGIYVTPDRTLGAEVRDMLALLSSPPAEISNAFGSERWDRMRQRFEGSLTSNLIRMLLE